MAVEVALGTPLAEALSSTVQPKLIEAGWTSEDDTSLAEYIILMLVNGKTREQIAEELAQDLLPDGEGTQEFAQWLFEQVIRLRGGPNPQQQPQTPAVQNQAIPSFQSEIESRPPQVEAIPQGDATMSEVSQSLPEGNVPTGPKAMRGGKQSGRGGRMAGNINKAMDRTNDSVLHRVRGQSGTGINRQAPRGPRNDQNRMMRPQMQQQLGAAMGLNTSMSNNSGLMSPQQQMQFMAMMEEQARMMAQFMPGMISPSMNPAFPNGSPAGRSLSDRIEAPGRGRGGRGERGGRGGKGSYQNGHGKSQQDGEDTAMDEDSNLKSEIEPSSSMDVESSQSNDTGPNSICRFNLKCTRKDCPFAHQSPAAPEGITVDVSDTCSFGAACKNHKCTARHPSPAQRISHQAEEQCKFYPNCTNPACSFKHPSLPMCRNGADCTVPYCKFTHLQTPCKFNPCLNPRCPFKHAEGQRGSYADKVWTAEGVPQKEDGHVSERRFVDDAAEEELIKPEASENQDGIVT